MLAQDAELNANSSIPSIVDHPQNRHHGGLLNPTRLCADCWLKLEASDPAAADAIARYWRYLGYGLTTRLWLATINHRRHVQPTDSVADALLALSPSDFWDHRKEVMDLIRDCTKGAKKDKIESIVAKIVHGPVLPDHIDPDDKTRILDAYRWPYLKALGIGNVQLPKHGQFVLEEINSRTTWSKRSLEESDYFTSWSYGLRRGPIGDPAPIAQAPTEERIEVARHLETTDLFNQADAWSVYCRHDPEGAFDALSAHDFSTQLADRWRDVIWAIIEIDRESHAEPRSKNLTSRAITYLRTNAWLALGPATASAVELFEHAIKVQAEVEPNDWDWLWTCSTVQSDSEPAIGHGIELGYDLLSRAIGSPPGKLARLLINNLGPRWDEISADDRERTVRRLRAAIALRNTAGSLARAQLVQFIAWIDASVPEIVDQDLLPCLEADTKEAAELRAIVLGMSRHIGPALRSKLRQVILNGVTTFKGSSVLCENAASRLVAYVQDDLSRDIDDPARLTPGAAKSALKAAGPVMMAAAAEILSDWLSEARDQPREVHWTEQFAPLFEQLWPSDKRAQTSLASLSLAKLAVAAGEKFPDALDRISPYLRPLDQDWLSLYSLSNSSAAPTLAKFPWQTLDLLWRLLQPAQRGQSHDLSKILEAISKAAPDIVHDRRYQLLLTRAVRVA